MTNSQDPAESKYWVKSVARAADILETLATAEPDRGMSVTEVARNCGIAKSATFGMLQTLRAYGLVSDDGEGMSRRYRLGMGLARLGDRARSQVSLRTVAHPVLRELTSLTGMASRLAVPEGGHAVVVDQVETDQRIRLDLRMGQRELPHCTGLGKALLSALSPAEAALVVERFGLPRRTARTITDPATLLAHLRDIDRIGYALDDEEDAEGVICVGAPVRDHLGGCAGAISITGLKLGLPAWRYQELGGQVRDAARRISEGLGQETKATAEDSVSEAIPQPVPPQAPQPSPQLASQAAPQPTEQPGSQPSSHPASQPSSQPIPPPAPQSSSQPSSHPVAQPAPQPPSSPAQQPPWVPDPRDTRQDGGSATGS